MLIGSHYAAWIDTTTGDLSDFEWPFHSSHAISAVAELLISNRFWKHNTVIIATFICFSAL